MGVIYQYDQQYSAAMAVDHVVDQGTSGIWIYRKWASGIAECWGTQILENHNISRAWGNWYVSDTVFYTTYPNNLFIQTPIEIAHVGSNNDSSGSGTIVVDTSGRASTTRTSSYAIARGNSLNNGTYVINYQAIGRWK